MPSGDMEMRSVRFTAHAMLTAWQWGPFPLLVVATLVAVAVWYLRADWKLAEKGRRWPAHRTASFLGGLVAVDLALQSPIATFTQSYFQAHIMQHLLLMIIAPPLLALGAPSTLLLQTARRDVKERWLAVLRSKPFAVLSHPITVWSLYFGAMFIFFMTSLINIAMQDMALMDAINVLFFLGGTLYWWPMVGLDPIVHWKMGYGARMVNILVGSVPETVMGVAILTQGAPIASMYTLSSTHAGGGLLWSSTELATFIGFIPIFLQWMRSDERRAERDDLRADRLAVAGGPSPSTLRHMSTTGASARRRLPTPASAWEQMWLARTGSLPTDDADPETHAGPG